MMVRMLLPLFADVEENPLYMLTVAISEPLIVPVRFLLDKFGIGTNTPIDLGFLEECDGEIGKSCGLISPMENLRRLHAVFKGNARVSALIIPCSNARV